MFTQEEYYWAWIVYGFSCLCLMACWWILTAKISCREIRHLLRLIPAVFLVVPWSIGIDQSYLAPAWFVSVADALTDGGQAFWRAGLALVIALVLSILLSFFYFCWRWARSYRGRENSGASRVPENGASVSNSTNAVVATERLSTPETEYDSNERKEPYIG